MALSLFSLNSKLFLQFSFLLFSFSYLHSFGLQKPLCHDGDHSNLLQFKQTFVFNNFSCAPAAYSKLNSWTIGDDCCLWDGVECNNGTGRVIGLDLSSSCLYGSMDSTSPLFRLVHLTSLNLAINNFNLSTIPGEIRSLSKLTHLNLTFSSFYGQIPLEILELSELVSLDLSLNPLVLQKPSLKDVAEKLTNLTQLHLNGVSISSSVPRSLSNLTSLSSLLLGDCSLHGQFPPSIFQLPNLSVLSIPHNPNLNGYLPKFPVDSQLENLVLDFTNFTGQLPLSISNPNSSLNFFSVRGCSFDGIIPSSIGNLTKLQHLDLGYNYFTGEMPSSLGNLFQLTFLSLVHNNFSPGTLHWLGKLTNLNILGLIKTNSYGTIPSSFQNMTQLQYLAIGENKLTGQIPNWLGNFTQLWGLSVQKNELQGPIPESIFRLPNIQDLELQFNNLSGYLRFDSFLQSKHLWGFQVSANHLSLVSSPYTNVTIPKFQILGLSLCGLKEFPTFLLGQNELEFLELASNEIEGYIPNWISTMESLSYLSLPNNSLTSFEQSFTFLSLPNLQLLDLRYNKFKGLLPIPPLSIVHYTVAMNKFSGQISPLFCNLTSLLTLELSGNRLTGNLPLCFGKLVKSAMVLDVRNNSLSGKIPDIFTGNCTLKGIDFSQNMFEGKVPRSLANCSKLEILNLEENHMNDVFPSWLGTLQNLRVLSLRSNKFHGAIGRPLSEFEFGKLHIIDISDNHFTGKLPLEYFQNWVAMKKVDANHLAYMQANARFRATAIIVTYPFTYSIFSIVKGTKRGHLILEFYVVVDLSSNSFEGEIPEIIGTLREIQSLNLSNNILTGQIPQSLANLTKLEALDLSLNKLSGEIPNQLSVLTFLEILNVSHNNLIGPIPQGNQFATFENDSFSDNPGLCGHPLSRKCGSTETLPLPPSEDEDSDSPFEFNWKIVVIGFASGSVIGVAYGCATNTWKYEWLVKRKYARWLRRRQRNRKLSCRF